ncbi:MAG: PEGA domain-containing protein [Candidatus Magasanikbacteria bacterium]|nr:PEGA domain-containing protein [Candidatus Magasanikbacteria bacterium]
MFAATLLMLFANGYRFKFHPFLISKTGNILATFIPTDATLSVDGSYFSNSSPARVRALFPGQHQISLSAPGYISYDRQLMIEPQQTAFVSDINLILDKSVDMAGPTNFIATTSTSPILRSTIAGHDISLATSTQTGTEISIDGSPATRDLGAGSWSIANGDTNLFGIIHADRDQIDFRSWNTPDITSFVLPGHSVEPHIFKSAHSLFAISNFELWRVDSDKKTAELVYRFSKPLVQVLPIQNTMLVLVRLPDQIVAFHIGDRHYIPTPLATDPHIVEMHMSADGTTLEYTTKNQNNDGYTAYTRQIST